MAGWRRTDPDLAVPEVVAGWQFRRLLSQDRGGGGSSFRGERGEFCISHLANPPEQRSRICVQPFQQMTSKCGRNRFCQSLAPQRGKQVDIEATADKCKAWHAQWQLLARSRPNAERPICRIAGVNAFVFV